MKRLLLPIALILLSLPVAAQVTNTTAGRIRSGAATPATCSPGQVFMVTGGSGGLYQCLAVNTWTFAGTSTGGTIPLASLPTIPNSQLQNSSIGITAGTGLSGGGITALGASATLNLDLTYSPTWTGNHTFSVNSGVAINQSGSSATNSFLGTSTFGSGSFASTPQVGIVASSTSTRNLVLKLIGSQTANALDVTDASNNVLFSVDKSGYGYSGAFIALAGSTQKAALNSSSVLFNGLGLSSDSFIKFSSTTAWSGTADVGLYRNAAGKAEVNSGTAGQYRDLALRAIYLNNSVSWTYGSGSPEGAVTAPVGSIYSRTDGGATTSLYVKESGSGNTGWAAK